nr:phosphotransferase [Streptomyces geranii]
MSHAPPLGALLRQYAAGSALRCDPVDQGLLNRGYRLATTRGDYFLKHHFDPETADPAAIARQHRATQRLADLGVPVAPPLPGRDGRTVAVVGGHAYALHPWIDGRHRHGGQLSTVQCGRLGALLGVVHASLEQVMPKRTEEEPAVRHRDAPAPRTTTDRDRPPPGQGSRPRRPKASRRPEPTNADEPARRIIAPGQNGHTDRHLDSRGPDPSAAHHQCVITDRSLPARRDRTEPDNRHQGHPTDPHRYGPTAPHRQGAPTARHPDTTAPAADPAETFTLIDDLLAHVRRHHPTDAFDELARYRLLERRALLEQHADRRPPPGGSVGWVHGDFHPFNLLYKGDAPAAIVDWDRLGVKPRAEEAVRAAAIFFVRPAGTLDLPKTRAYARAYRRTSGATPSELAAAVHRVWWERLNDFWMLRWHYERGDTRADSQFPAASALAVWWTREYDAVCEAFTG